MPGCTAGWLGLHRGAGPQPRMLSRADSLGGMRASGGKSGALYRAELGQLASVNRRDKERRVAGKPNLNGVARLNI
jgi:hypothetical protein